MLRYLAPTLFTLILSLFLLALPDSSQAHKTYGTRHTLKLVVSVTAEGLGGILEGVTSEQEHIEIIRKYIKPIRFFPDLSGYFFVYTIDGICVAHATQPELVGQNLFEKQDAHGLFVIKNFVNIAKKGGGFLEYSWNKPGSDIVQDKLGYVAPIPGTQLFIGSGIYFSSLQ